MIGAAGGGGGTDWTTLGVGRMWAMLEGHDDAAHRRLIDGWRRSSELVAQHLGNVRRYRADLAAAWPPSGSPAAAAYLERLDGLIANLEETYEAAVANHRAFAGATGALESARTAMAGIRREHAANEVRLAAFAEDKRGFELGGGKGGVVVPPSPVAAGRQAELEARARSVMSALSTELAQAQTALTTPALYRSRAIADAGGRDFTAATAARLPLPQAAPTLSSMPRPTPGPTSGPTPGPTSGPMPGPTSGPTPGPMPGPTAGPTAARLAELSPRIPGIPRTGLEQPDPASKFFDPIGRPPADGLITPRLPGSGAPDEPAEARPTRNTALSLPPGGVIGGVVPRQPGNPGAPPRVNPVGGLIGPPPSAAPGAPAQRPQTRRSPDEPWPAREGVDPIILPPPERPIDPGPAIGLR